MIILLPPRIDGISLHHNIAAQTVATLTTIFVAAINSSYLGCKGTHGTMGRPQEPALSVEYRASGSRQSVPRYRQMYMEHVVAGWLHSYTRNNNLKRSSLIPGSISQLECILVTDLMALSTEISTLVGCQELPSTPHLTYSYR